MSEETKIKAGPIDINEAVNAALTNPEMNRQAAVESIQKSFETFAESVNVQLDTAFPPDAGEAVAKAMTPVVEKLELLISKLDAGTQAQAVQPIQKSLSPIGMPVQQVPKGDAISPITGQPSKIRQAVEHSMRINQ
ncbi:MAG: hypothetical protein GY796_02120 [Chloroflexi bacterium]|nr:hypothetical protein [Chloroflexota bacterium]